jgi:ketosteroid isomerase-like protein
MRFVQIWKTRVGIREGALLVVPMAIVGSFLLSVRGGPRSPAAQATVKGHMYHADQAGIEELHRKDVAATLASDPQLLAELWTDDAVRLQPGGPAEVGLAVIRENDQKQRAEHPGAKVLSYRPQIRDVQIEGDWAFEWNDFEVRYKESQDGKTATLHGKTLRVLKKQGDGSWRFARVMWNLSE